MPSDQMFSNNFSSTLQASGILPVATIDEESNDIAWWIIIGVHVEATCFPLLRAIQIAEFPIKRYLHVRDSTASKKFRFKIHRKKEQAPASRYEMFHRL